MTVYVPCLKCGLPVSPGACAGEPLVYHDKPEHCRDALKAALDVERAACRQLIGEHRHALETQAANEMRDRIQLANERNVALARADSLERELAILSAQSTATDEELLRVVNERAEEKARTDALVKTLPTCGRFCLPSNLATKINSIGVSCDACERTQPQPKAWNIRDLKYAAPLRAILAARKETK